MTTALFDEEIHAPTRLRICAALAPVRRADFATLRDALGVADSVLSKHLARLQAIDYVLVTKESFAGRLRTRVELTAHGRQALGGHLAALRALADSAQPSPDPPP